MTNHSPPLNQQLLANVRELLNQSRKQVFTAINTAMVQTYWQIGCLIVEDEQQGKARAGYGKHILKQLSESLTKEFAKGFDTRNLRNMRKFYLTFPNRNAVRTELSWTHYRTLIRIDNTPARNWYMYEAIAQSWSARALDRQIGSLYYERLLSSKEKQPIIDEAAKKVKPWRNTRSWRTVNNCSPRNILTFCQLKTNCKQSWSENINYSSRINHVEL